VPPPNALPATSSPTAMANLLRLHSEAESLARNAPAILNHPESARSLEHALIQALMACIAAPDLPKERPARHRHHAIMTRFRAALQESDNQAVYLPELRMATGTSARTLTACCQEYLGMSPKRFLTLRRLHLAHHVLHKSDSANMTVTEIATKFGFWELGCFAIQYKSVFSESPSATLRHSFLSRSVCLHPGSGVEFFHCPHGKATTCFDHSPAR
jgi:AraC-like DNA-binding protein